MQECGILLGGQAIGRAQVWQEGLYYRFFCRCRLSGEVIYRLKVRCGDRVENLGIPVPKDGAFELETRIPVKKLGSGQMQITAIPKQTQMEGKFIPLSPEEPFRYLKRLEDAFLQVRDGKVGIVIPELQ